MLAVESKGLTVHMHHHQPSRAFLLQPMACVSLVSQATTVAELQRFENLS